MKRETIFLGFFSLLLALGMDALTDSRTWVTLWIAFVALWGVCTTMTLSERLENQEKERLTDLQEPQTPKENG